MVMVNVDTPILKIKNMTDLDFLMMESQLDLDVSKLKVEEVMLQVSGNQLPKLMTK